MMRLTNLCVTVLFGAMMFQVDFATAQTCTGTSGFGAELLNLSANAAYVNNTYTLGARVGAAGKRMFGGVHFAAATYDGETRNAYRGGADIGAIIPLGAMKKYVLCPVIDYGYQAGPHLYGIDEDIHYVSYHTVSPGLALGYTITFGERFSLIPFLGTALQWSRYEQRVPGKRERDILFRSTSRIGIALQLYRNFVVRTSVGVPLASMTDRTMTSVGGSFSFASPHTKYNSSHR